MPLKNTNLTKYEDVKNQTTEEYFNNNDFSVDAFENKYACPGETYVQSIKRVCDYIASAEDTAEKRKYWSERWFDEIYNDWWHPAGSIMQGAGIKRKVSMANCFSIDTPFITSCGVKTFADFNDNDEIKVLNNRGIYVTARVRKFGVEPLYKLTVSRANHLKEVYCTKDHIWRTLVGETIVEKRTCDLVQNDFLPFTKRKWMPGRNGDRYFCPIGFVHGYVFGDGEYNKELDTCELHLCDDSVQLVKMFTGFDWSINRNRESQKIISVEYLPKWFKNEIPNLSQVNEEYVLGFIAGYFAADGTVDKDGRAELASATFGNLLAVKNLIESVGIYSSNIRLIRDKSPFDDNPNHKLYGLYLWKECLFDSFFVEPLHKKHWQEYKDTVFQQRRQNWKVLSVELTERIEETWCVEVPGDENFTLSGGLNTHNCTTVSMGAINPEEEWDSLESIIRNTAYTVAKTAAYRQGLGVDFSRIRPVGTKVLNSSNESSGSIHWMKLIDSLGYYVGQKGRIPAMLFSLSCTHPDLENFITVKSDKTKIQNANISVQCTDAFYKAVADDDDWTLFFEIPAIKKGQKVYIDVHSATKDSLYDENKKKYYYVATHDRPYEKVEKIVKARKILEMIANGMLNNAEPGIQNIDLARKYSNSDYVYDPNDPYDSRIISSNACSEQYLSRDSLCVLSSSNAGKFSVEPEKYEVELAKIGESINRFLDNVNEMELRERTYATPFQKMAIEKLRRTGAGITNISGWLFKKNLEYGTEEGNEAISHFVERYNYHLYKSSIALGKEKGNFGLFNKSRLEKSPFIQRMKKLGLRFDTLRNITVSSIAPTGTLSLMFRGTPMSYGVEPPFGLYYWKRTRITGKYEYYFCVPQIVLDTYADAGYTIDMASSSVKDTWDGKIGLPIAQFIEEKKEEIGIKFRKATEVSPFEKLDLMSKLMKSIDSSISVTYMLDENAKWKDVYDFILLAHKKEIKSIAAFPDRKMYGIVSYIPFKDLAIKLKKEGIQIHNQNFTVEELKQLDQELQVFSSDIGALDSKSTQETAVIKRPRALPCDVHHVKITKKLDKIRTFEYLVVVGMIDDSPYEVFSFENGKLDKSYTKGEVIKHGKGRYQLCFSDGTQIDNFTKDTTESEDALTRMTSISLRHGVPIEFVVDQLEKVEGDLFTFSKAIARALKKYIKNGVKVTGFVCPSCGKDDTIVRQEGCITCGCGFSKCS